MKLLKIENNQGWFREADNSFSTIEKITKEKLLLLVNWALDGDEAKFDAYDEGALRNQAHQVIYKSLEAKLRDLTKRRKEFVDASKRLYLKEYEKYVQASESPSAAEE